MISVVQICAQITPICLQSIWIIYDAVTWNLYNNQRNDKRAYIFISKRGNLIFQCSYSCIGTVWIVITWFKYVCMRLWAADNLLYLACNKMNLFCFLWKLFYLTRNFPVYLGQTIRAFPNYSIFKTKERKKEIYIFLYIYIYMNI